MCSDQHPNLMKTITILGIGLVVVFLCLVGSYFLMEGSNNGETQDFLGEWTLEHYAEGKYVGGEPRYKEMEVWDLEMKITDRKDGFYDIQIGDERSVGVLHGNYLSFSMLNADVIRGFVKADGDWIKVSTIDYSTCSASVLDFVRKGVDAGDGVPAVENDMPADGTVLDAFQADVITSNGTKDMIPSNYSFEMLENHGDMAFYISHYAGSPGIDFMMVSIMIDEGQWFSMAPFQSSTAYMTEPA